MKCRRANRTYALLPLLLILLFPSGKALAEHWTVVELQKPLLSGVLQPPDMDINHFGQTAGGAFTMDPISGAQYRGVSGRIGADNPALQQRVINAIADNSSFYGTATNVSNPPCSPAFPRITPIPQDSSVALPSDSSANNQFVVGNCYAGCTAEDEFLPFPPCSSGFTLSSVHSVSFVPTAVNDNALYVGNETDDSRNPSTYQGQRLNDMGTIENLPTLGGSATRATGLNNAKLVVGGSDTAAGMQHAFIFDPDTASIDDLGTLGGDTSIAWGINNFGAVVGTAKNAVGDDRAFLYTEGGGLQDLNSFLAPESDWVLQSAKQINDRNEIVGMGLKGGEARSFVLGPPALVLDSEKHFHLAPRADIAVWRPSNGTWYVRNLQRGQTSDDGLIVVQWGLPGDIPVQADYDNDRILDLIVWRPSNGVWYICQSSDGFDCSKALTFQFGLPGDIPLVGDLDNDGETDLVVWRPIYGFFIYRQSSDNAVVVRQWGLPRDVPMLGDFDGDKLVDLAVWRPAFGVWYVALAANNYSGVPGQFYQIQWGLLGDFPINGDFDGDGSNDLVVWRPGNGNWYVCPSRRAFDCAQNTVIQWGLPGDVPVMADVDLDGSQDFVVWRVSTGTWYVYPRNYDRYDSVIVFPPTLILYQTAIREPIVEQWGLPGDLPVGFPRQTS